MFMTSLASPQTRLMVVLAVALAVSLVAHVVRPGSPTVEASDGSAPSRSPGFLSARIGPVIGRSTLDLRDTGIAPGEGAVVTVFVALGRVTLRVPDGWEVDATALSAISPVSDTRRPRSGDDDTAASPATGPAPRLVLQGVVIMGAVEVAS